MINYANIIGGSLSPKLYLHIYNGWQVHGTKRPEQGQSLVIHILTYTALSWLPTHVIIDKDGNLIHCFGSLSIMVTFILQRE